MSTGFSSFDDEFTRASAKPQYASDQTQQIPDGSYDVEITAGVMKETVTGEVFTFLGTVLTDGPYRGWKLERTIFFHKKNGSDEEKFEYTRKRIAELKTDLATLGFDVHNWTSGNGRPFSSQLKIACSVMRGCRVKMAKKTGEMVNVYLNKRFPDLDGKPAKFGPAEMVADATTADGTQQGFDVNANTGDQSPDSHGPVAPPPEDLQIPF